MCSYMFIHPLLFCLLPCVCQYSYRYLTFFEAAMGRTQPLELSMQKIAATTYEVNKEESNDKMLPGRVFKNIRYTPNAVTLVHIYKWNSVAEYHMCLWTEPKMPDDSGVVKSVYLVLLVPVRLFQRVTCDHHQVSLIQFKIELVLIQCC